MKTEEEIKERIEILKNYAAQCYQRAEQRAEFDNALRTEGKIKALEWVLEN